MSAEARCCSCGRSDAELGPDDGLLPYGTGGQPICCGCGLGDERRAETLWELGLRLRAKGER